MVTAATEIKIQVLPGRKAMTSLDSILKSRNIILPTKVHLVKAMVFPVVTYRCESWSIKKPEHQTVADYFWWVPKSLQMVIAAMKLKFSVFRELPNMGYMY